MLLTTHNDPLGKAVSEYWKNPSASEDIIVHCNLSEDDVISPKKLFRSFSEMPMLEQKALELCTGTVLDIGAGSGCHSIILQERGLDVYSIDISKGAVEVMKKRGLRNVEQADILSLTSPQFDTILLLMNGVGIAGTLAGLNQLLVHLKSLLKKGGKILLDSTDLIYLYTEEDGSVWVDLNAAYYGEVNYQMEYKDVRGDWFPWLFVDFGSLSEAAEKAGLSCKCVLDGDYYDYLAELSIIA